ncbi:hypothetical protein P7K49_020265 [Saguinus oedipus]|uniref:Uncharacterized protein n=1 Tax=Saguinus oedipus TaxID=9490 RepID=A0ABQ9UZT5_SAGOE|nr:hypothetical protein P7K49_020265 [Saguinus oedipus]
MEELYAVHTRFLRLSTLHKIFIHQVFMIQRPSKEEQQLAGAEMKLDQIKPETPAALEEPPLRGWKVFVPTQRWKNNDLNGHNLDHRYF